MCLSANSPELVRQIAAAVLEMSICFSVSFFSERHDDHFGIKKMGI
jgi:hypothetical protein